MGGVGENDGRTNATTIVSHVTFSACNFGVSNGVASGCPRGHVEIWNPLDPTSGRALYGNHAINFDGCSFEGNCLWAIDYAGNSSGPLRGQGTPVAGHSSVTNCLFKGNTEIGTIAIEGGAGDFTISGNTFYRGTAPLITALCAQSVTITGNTFDYTLGSGSGDCIALSKWGPTGEDDPNAVYTHDCTATGNTFKGLTQGSNDFSINAGCTNITHSPNTYR